MSIRHCPALLIGAPASKQGKTTVTAALARLHARQGRKVRVFKCGPDFLDPMILSRASGAPVYQLDLWMVGEQESRRLLWDAAGEADLILIEGVMGLFDGQPSSADLAVALGVPALALIDASAMAQTFGAVALGMASYRPELVVTGVLANRVAGARHGELLRASVPESLRWYGALPRGAGFELPSRHLGLVQADELADLDARLDAAADALLATAGDALPAAVAFAAPAPRAVEPWLADVRIAVARDAACNFLYQANLDLLREMGAELTFFSLLDDAAPPPTDSIYLPGGYPELHLQRLQDNHGMRRAIAEHYQSGCPLLAECGGMLYLLDSLTDLAGQRGHMLGLIAGNALLEKRFTALALQEVELPEGRLRGHTFHHSRLPDGPQPLARGDCPNGKDTREAVYRQKRLTASYIHFYMPSNPRAAAALLRP